MRDLGVFIEVRDNRCFIHGQGKDSLKESSAILDCNNSGTTMRLMAGLLSAMPFLSILSGSEQLRTRPMDRVIKPLKAMGAHIVGRAGNKWAPLVSMPSALMGIEHELSIKSAQVKSALILAGLYARGQTRIYGDSATRDHSERLLSFMGADISTHNNSVVIEPLKDELKPLSLKIPGDMSSAAFMLVAGVLCADKGLLLREVGINKTRTGLIDALLKMGAFIKIDNERIVANEAVADIYVKKSPLKGALFSGDHIVRMIDEIPILALAATQAEGLSVIKDASELKVKESNRIKKTVQSLKQLGADIEERDDGMIIKGPHKLHGAELSSYGDHRLALFLSIAGLIASHPVIIPDAYLTDDSYPGFFAALKSLGAFISEN
jgi:3-phosphoshikimate 1-carboxyvinyltransferase